MRHRVALLTLLTASLLPGLAGCGGEGGSSQSPVVVDGSSTVFRISRAAVEAFQKEKPDIDVIVHQHGTGGGFGKYAEGEIDIIDASRPAKPEEEAKAKASKMPWTRYLVGYDGITVVVNPGNDFVKAMTVAQLKALFEPDSKVKTWKDLDPSWPDRPITLYTPDKDSGTFEFFTEAITGKARAQRSDVQPSPNDNVLVTGVAGDVDALGYFGYAYFASNSSKLRAIPVQANADAPAILPDPQTILDKTYTPLARPLFIYVKNSSMARPEVLDFVTFYLDRIGTLAEEAGYVPPTSADQDANRKTLEGLTTTTTAATRG